LQRKTGRGRTAAGSERRAAPGCGTLVLHCPTGHLSAAVAGIACGRLPPTGPPDSRTLASFFARSLDRRGPGRIIAVSPPAQLQEAEGGSRRPGPGGPGILCLARGATSRLMESALSEVARVAGLHLWIQPALRAAGCRPGRGQTPTAPRLRPDPALFLASLAARGLAAIRLHRQADRLMAAQVRRLYPEIAERAAGLPGRSLREPAPGVAGGRRTAVCVVYHCFGAAHTSVAAAALHCGRLPAHGPVSAGEVLSVPGFDRRAGSDIGGAFYVGRDSRCCDVFVIGFDGSRRLIARAALELLGHLQGSGGPVVLSETLPAASLLVKIGGYTSRRLGLVRLGRPLAALGVVFSIPALRRTVGSTRLEISRLLEHQASGGGPGPEGTGGDPGAPP